MIVVKNLEELAAGLDNVAEVYVSDVDARELVYASATVHAATVKVNLTRLDVYEPSFELEDVTIRHRYVDRHEGERFAERVKAIVDEAAAM